MGAGMTGLALARATGWPVYEAQEEPGGLCASYYVRPGTAERLPHRPADDEAYRFEVGGGHWIFGGDPAVLRWLRTQVTMRTYARRSAVFFPEERRTVPYPLQYHLGHLPAAEARQALAEIEQPPGHPGRTMGAWLHQHFGPTLSRRFFDPFHALYTAGLWNDIAPQDAYKSPLHLDQVRRGLHGGADAAGYNTRYLYPEGGLDALSRRLAEGCDVRYDKRVVRVDAAERRVHFADGTEAAYEMLASTLPLDRMVALTDGIETEQPADPYTSVLVLNLGARRGPACPDAHWIYVPHSAAGFHRVGCYSNVDADFLPASRRDGGWVSLYVERSFPGGARPSEDEVAAYTQAVIDELQAWRYIGEVDAADPTWIDAAYTWAWPRSMWRSDALRRLAERDLHMVGRYGRWIFQGIADSLRDGLMAGTALRQALGA